MNLRWLKWLHHLTEEKELQSTHALKVPLFEIEKMHKYFQ